MSDYGDVRAALARQELERARDLLRGYLDAEPESAEVWYLAAQAAVNDRQQRHFLEKAVELDPLHAAAGNALHDLLHPTPAPAIQPAPVTTSQPALAPLGNRALAFLIDYAVMLGAAFALWILTGLIFSLLTSGTVSTGVAVRFFMVWMLLSFITYMAYYVHFLTRFNGQTPGKRWLGVRVVKRNGQPLTWWDAFLRCWVGYLLAMSPLGLGFFWALIDPQRRGWHDIVADTLVVQA